VEHWVRNTPILGAIYGVYHGLRTGNPEEVVSSIPVLGTFYNIEQGFAHGDMGRVGEAIITSIPFVGPLYQIEEGARTGDAARAVGGGEGLLLDVLVFGSAFHMMRWEGAESARAVPAADVAEAPPGASSPLLTNRARLPDSAPPRPETEPVAEPPRTGDVQVDDGGTTRAEPNDLAISRASDWSDRGLLHLADGRVIPTHGARYLHGARSGSLLSFTDYAGEARGALLPMGELEAKGIIPFAGELGHSLSDQAFARDRLSVVNIMNTACLDYAEDRTRAWTPALAREQLDLYERMPPFPGEEDVHARSVDLRRKQLEIWETLPKDQKALVSEAFPVVYGIRTTEEGRVVYPGYGSDVNEAGLSGGAGPADIRVVFVPDNRIELVKSLIASSPRTAHIAVESIDSLKGLPVPTFKLELRLPPRPSYPPPPPPIGDDLAGARGHTIDMSTSPPPFP
jgi:hypothetical protein